MAAAGGEGRNRWRQSRWLRCNELKGDDSVESDRGTKVDEGQQNTDQAGQANGIGGNLESGSEGIPGAITSTIL